VKTKDIPNSSKEPGRRYGDTVLAPREILFRSPQLGRTLSKKGWFGQGIWIVKM
jgi:hypothetical protein